MAQRLFDQESFQLEKNPVRLYAHLTFGASGAVTLDQANSKGFSAAVHGSAGVYTLTFGQVHPGGVTTLDTYVKVLQVKALWDATGNSGTAPAAPLVYVTGNHVATAGTASLQVTCLNVSDTATNPASGEGLYLEVELGNSTSP